VAGFPPFTSYFCSFYVWKKETHQWWDETRSKYYFRILVNDIWEHLTINPLSRPLILCIYFSSAALEFNKRIIYIKEHKTKRYIRYIFTPFFNFKFNLFSFDSKKWQQILNTIILTILFLSRIYFLYFLLLLSLLNAEDVFDSTLKYIYTLKSLWIIINCLATTN